MLFQWYRSIETSQRPAPSLAYGPNLTVVYRHAADYVDKLLKGEPPSALPVEQPVSFDLVLNVRTAKALGLTIPESLLIRADKIIK
jgi:ABC-type uncharacterized transport system substrate-binding protein